MIPFSSLVVFLLYKTLLKIIEKRPSANFCTSYKLRMKVNSQEWNINYLHIGLLCYNCTCEVKNSQVLCLKACSVSASDGTGNTAYLAGFDQSSY